jgi:uncharacterized protein DUF6600/FecR-like protein
MHGRLLLTFALAAFVCPAVYAQPQQSETDGTAPAHVAHVDGTVTLEREGRAEHSPLNMPLLSGDRLRTEDGRVEVLFADGSTLHLDMRSTIDVQSDDLVRLTEGRLRVNILGRARTVAYRIDSAAGSARITQPGEYRIALLRGNAETQLELAVVRGAAEVFTDQGSTPVRAGERAYASAGLAPSYPYSYNSANWDAFDRWSEARRDVRLGVSSQYLPSDMQSYAPLLDQSGDWRYTQSYGYAWYPRVSMGWRPYYYGRWASYPRYGWTWIGADPFAWPTHHYGRWGLSAGVWFWIPSSHWAPAYVSWAYAPGYVSWCPLGFDNRPILSIDIYRVGPDYYSPWRAWTAVSYSHFGSRDSYVNQRAVNWDRFDRGQRPRFETRPSAPGLSRDIAVPRDSTPIRWAGSRDLPLRGDVSPRGDLPPRAGTSRSNEAVPRYVNRGDDIVRSQTERPAPRAPGGGLPIDGAQGRPLREGSAVPRASETAPTRVNRRGVETRTIPEGPARPARPEFESRPVDRPVAQPRTHEPVDGAQGRPFDRSQDGAQGRPRGGGGVSYPPFDTSRASGSPRAEPRGDAAQGRPYPTRGYEPRSRPVPESSPAPGHEVPPMAYERPRPRSESEAAPQRQPMPERAAPVERAPSRGEGRQPPPDRGAQPDRAAPRETAAPRGGGVSAPRPRGGGGS